MFVTVVSSIYNYVIRPFTCLYKRSGTILSYGTLLSKSSYRSSPNSKCLRRSVSLSWCNIPWRRAAWSSDIWQRCLSLVSLKLMICLFCYCIYVVFYRINSLITRFSESSNSHIHTMSVLRLCTVVNFWAWGGVQDWAVTPQPTLITFSHQGYMTM